MKKIIIGSLLFMVSSGAVFAATDGSVMNEHERAAISHQRMNNSEAPVHQQAIADHLKQAGKADTSIKADNAIQVQDIGEHERAVMSHQRMNNSEAPVHQQAIETHNKLAGSQ